MRHNEYGYDFAGGFRDQADIKRLDIENWLTQKTTDLSGFERIARRNDLISELVEIEAVINPKVEGEE